MSKVLSISESYVKAVEGADIPTLRVSGVVGENFSGSQLSEAVAHYSGGSGEVRLILDSVGGYASDAFHFYDYVRANGLKVHVDGYGTVASAATIIMAAAGRKRSRLSPNSEYLVHNATGGDAEGVARANVKMAAIYSELSGKDSKAMLSLMKQDKPMSAKDAVKMGFVGSLIELQRLAAHKTTTMEDTTMVKRTFAIDRNKALSALVTGELELEVDVNSELTEQVGTLTTELKAKATEIDELKGEGELKAEANTAKEKAEAEVETLKALHLTELEKIGTEAEALRAEVKKLKETPITTKVTATAADDVQDPGTTTDAPRFKKQTGAERAAAMQARLREPATN